MVVVFVVFGLVVIVVFIILCQRKFGQNWVKNKRCIVVVVVIVLVFCCF